MRVFPACVIADDTANRGFMIALDESLRSVSDPLHLKPIERAYAERAMKQRLHQPEFRGRIMLAYDQRRTICALKHGKLLDAAHIIRCRAFSVTPRARQAQPDTLAPTRRQPVEL